MRVLFCLLLFTGPIAAQDVFDIEITAACMEEANSYEERQYCVGASTRRCSEHLEDPIMAVMCAKSETIWWEAQIATLVQTISRSAETNEAQAKALARMQADWLRYRDNSCAFEQAFGAGQAAPEVDCLLWMTGDQAVYLFEYAPGY